MTGAITVVVLLAAILVVVRITGREPGDTLHLTVRTPYLGQGITAGSAVMLHGVPVGRVETVRGSAGRGVELDIRLRRNQIGGLTDSVGFDYRPMNYFGVSALNLLPGAGGRTLADGQRLERAPEGDFTMAMVLNRSSAVVNGVVTDRMVEVIRRIADYTDALAPLLEAGFTTANTIAEAQRRMPDAQLRDLNALLDPMPLFIDDAITAVTAVRDIPGGQMVVDHYGPMNDTMQLIATGFFGPLGALLGSHAADFTPMTEIVRVLSDLVSGTVRKARLGARLDQVLSGFESAYTGPDQDKSLRLRIVLDELPFLAAPLPLPGGN
ncbi:MlaD family protein [Nocardia seriolae]|uniref:Mce/MlaD domain-containing protein n=1 Tax=Nocardia seriolae TaxID=37332 RepID=A0ABC9Z1P6_9NOCA|nr:MlaD family protein [Nocardia seriolae]APA99823.1 hypothetical protein NS506_05780 [Nocardia seriolae]QOW36331.1 MCE family protein [Nocardia seriolae]QUN16161.1 MCE family protein [Nocardia seriolae]WKY55011.1 MlaD family protein [Nocardia seriolae]WNJ56787.1 MlaD family protein [Nocardia seriolae]